MESYGKSIGRCLVTRFASTRTSQVESNGKSIARCLVTRFASTRTSQGGKQRAHQSDFHAQLSFAGHVFNVVFEIDNGTEPLDSQREHSIRTKVFGYETYQDWVMRLWKESGEVGTRPGFLVVFLPTGMERVNHIVWLARDRESAA